MYSFAYQFAVAGSGRYCRLLKFSSGGVLKMSKDTPLITNHVVRGRTSEISAMTSDLGYGAGETCRVR